MSTLSHGASLIRAAAHPAEAPEEFDPLLQKAGRAEIVLIGEASHGTEEFYRIRAELTKRLISEHGFRAVLCEADWPDSFAVHRYVTGRSDAADAETALRGFERFPAWMWRNTVVVEFVEWLRAWNAGLPKSARPGGFYGMDLYSMHRSIEAVLGYLDKVDPKAARRARSRYGCFEHFSQEPQRYGAATELRGEPSCEEEVVAQVLELQRKQAELMRRDGRVAEEEFFSAEQNARLVANAEQYYRSMYRGRDESWNLRDTHMFETLCELAEHLDGGAPAKLVVWAHNSHLGDARATEMSERGELNVGQLVKERFGGRAYAIGFSTYTGTVTAADDWGTPARRKHVRPGLRGSYEELFHAVDRPAFWLDLHARSEAIDRLRDERLQRAIGVVYRPETERWSHYFHARLPEQFDALIHLDHTHALHPLEKTSEWDESELPETWPEAL
jgi:erythromycin esterase-like protein